MSPTDLLPPDVDERVILYSARLARKRQLSKLAAPARSDRRAHVRHPASDLEWLESVRLNGAAGHTVRLIDLSEGGALLEVDAPLRPGVHLTLEIAGSGLDAPVPLEVVRSYIASLKGDVTLYRTACLFAHAIHLPSSALPASSTPFVGAAAALRYLRERCDDEAIAPGSTVTLARADLLQVLESIHGRGAASADVVGRGTLELLGAVLPALQRGASRQDAAAALECRYRTLPRHLQTDLLDATRTLESLIARCFPAADPPAVAAPAEPSAAHVESAMQKIVVRYADGSLQKGFTQDFHPSRPHFSLWPSLTAGHSERVLVPMSKLKAVFFVRDFNGNPGYRERKSFTSRGQGRRIEVTFVDTEVILGTTLNYRPDGHGFFVVPADPNGNNTRIFVLASALRHVRFV